MSARKASHTRKTTNRRVPLVAKAAVAIGVVAALTGGAWAYALSYFAADYSWFTSMDEGTYYISSAGQMQALSNLVDGTWELDEAALGEGEGANAGQALPESVQDALMDYADGAYDFAGKTVQMSGSLDFLLGLGTVKPIGTAEHAFNGAFDGNGRDVGSLLVTNVPENPEDPDEPVSPVQYVGLFGHVGPQGSVSNLTLGRGCEIRIQATNANDHVAYVGSVVGYCEGTVSNVTSQAALNVTWDDGNGGDDRCEQDYTNVYVIDGVGGIAGYCDGDVSGAAFKGAINVNTPANAAWVAEADTNEAVVARYIGGVVGRSGGDPNTAGAGQACGTLTACTNTGDINVATTGAGGTDRFGETVDSKSRYVGGIAGYAIGDIEGCSNSGDITATSHAGSADLSNAQNLSAHYASDGGAEGCGGIVGGFRSQGAGGTLGRTLEGPAANDAYLYGGIKVDRGIAGGGEVIQISNCTNTGSVIACNNVGGIAGATGTYTRVYRCANGDAKLYAQNDEVGHVVSVRWNKPNTGGLVGRCYGDIAYSRNHGEVETTKGGYYVGGLAGDLYYYRDASNDKFVTPEVWACYNTGQVVCSKTYRRGALLGGNGGYIHDCLFLYGTSSAAEDEGIFAIGQEKGEDNPLKANLGIAYASDSQAAAHGEDAFSLKSAQAVAWLNNSAMCTDKLTGQTGWDSEVYYMATAGANRGYPVLLAEGAKATTRIDLEALDPTIEIAEDATFTTAYNPAPKLRVTITVNGAEQVLVENADYYVVADPAALENGVCKGTTDGQRIYTAKIKGIGNYRSAAFGSVAYAIGRGDFAECSISAVTDTFTNEEKQPQVTVLDPAGGTVDPGTYDIVVNEGKPCIAPDSYAVMATAKPNSNYAGHCSGTYAIAKIDIARNCDVIGVVYDEAEHGGVDESLADPDAKPRVWLYDDETYRLYEVAPRFNDAGEMETYTQADLDALRGTAIPVEAPDAVVAGCVGYPKLEGFEVYREDDGDRWLTRATPAATDDKGATVFGMELEYTAGELRPDVIGVNWAQGKLQFEEDGKVDVPWRLIFGGGSGGSTISAHNAQAAEGTLNIESSTTGAITVARYDTGFGRYLTNYDVITFDIAQAKVEANQISISQEGAKTVYKVDEFVKAPTLIVRYKGNVVDPANYTIAVDRVTDLAGREVSRRAAYLEGDTVYYKVVLKGSLSCSEPLMQDSDGHEIACYVVKNQVALTAERFDVVFEDGWERIDDPSSVDKWKKRFTLDEGIDVPIVRVTDTQADGGEKQLAYGRDYKLAFSYEDRPGGWRLGESSPSVQVIGMNDYAGALWVRYRIEKGVLTQDDLNRMASGSYVNDQGQVSAKIAGIDQWRDNDVHNTAQTNSSWMSQFGPFVAYRPHGYTADELAERIGIGFSTSTEWGCGRDADLFDVVDIEKDSQSVGAACEIGAYTATLIPGERGRLFDVENGASVKVGFSIVAPNLTSGDWNVFVYENGRARVSMMDYSSFRLSLQNSTVKIFAYVNTKYPYTGGPVKPQYLLRDNDFKSNSLWREMGSREDGLETDEEALERLRRHAFSYDDYEVVVEGYENAGDCPTDVGDGYQIVAVTGSSNGLLKGRCDVLSNFPADNVYSIVAADISDSDVVGIAIGSAEKPNDASANVGFIGANGAEPEVRFYVDSDGNGSYDDDEQCAYVEGEDYEVEYLNNQDITEGADATARIWIKDMRHLSAKANGARDLLRGWYYDVPFKVEGDAVYLNGDGVAWNVSDTLVVNADGMLSSPVGTATYQIGEGDAQVTKEVPASAYTLKVGVLEDGAFVEKESGWNVGDTVQIAVQPTNPAGRFTLAEGPGPAAVVAQATVVAASADNDFSAQDSKLKAELESTPIVYNGAPQEPSVTVSSSDEGVSLAKDVDYELAYADNVNAGDGTATVTVTGVGAYTGSRTLSFGIQKLDLSECTVTCDEVSYSGSQIQPTAECIHVFAGENELAADSAGWEVGPDGYGENVNAGEDAGSFALTATADGNLIGSKDVTFSITGRSLDDCTMPSYRDQQAAVPEDGRLLTVDQFNRDGGIVITDAELNRNLVVGEDFTVIGIANADGFANADEDTATGSVRYLGYATLTVRGLGNYSGIATVDIPLASKSLADATVEFAEGEGGPYAYTGEDVKPSVVVKLDEEELELGVDYRLAYAGNKNVGTATVTVNGMGTYTGSSATTKLSFEIEPVNVSGANSSYALAVDEIAYSGAEVQVSGTLVLRDEKVPAGNISYAYASIDSEGEEHALDAAPTEPGSYRVTATATTGNLLGKAKADFRIVPANLSTCSLKVERAEYAFGGEVKPAVKIVTPAKAELDPVQVGCTVAYESADGAWNIGDTAYATVTAEDTSRYFSGTMSQSFTVTRILINRLDVLPADGTQFDYTGNPIMPKLTVTVGGRTLAKGEDYTVVALSDDLTSVGGKTLELATPDTSVYEAQNVLISYEVVKKDNPPNPPTQLVVDGAAVAKPTTAPSTPTVVSKKANTLVAKAKKKTVTVKYSKVKKKKQTVKNLKVTSPVGKVTYKNVSTQKKSKKFKVSSKGVVTVTKKTKKGTYKVKIKITAAGDASYEPASKTVTFKIKVK